MATAQPCPTVPPNRVDLINEDEARSILLPLHEEVSDPRSANPDKHLDKITPGDTEEGDAGLSGNRLGKECLARAGRAYEKDPLRNTPPKLGKLLGILEKLNNLLKLLLRLVDTGDILEGRLMMLLCEELGLALPERHCLTATPLHLSHEEYPDTDKEEHGEPRYEHGHPPRRLSRRFCRYCYPLFAEVLHKIGIVGSKGLETATTPHLADNITPLYGNLRDLPLIHSLDKVAECYLILLRPGLAEEVKE